MNQRKQQIMRKILDNIFRSKKLSIIVPLIISTVLYLLFVFFGNSEHKTSLAIKTPVLSIICFFGVFLVFFVQIKVSMCPEWFLNFFEFLAVGVFLIFSLVEFVLFIVSGFQDFNPGLFLGPVAFSAVSWAHSQRTKSKG